MVEYHHNTAFGYFMYYETLSSSKCIFQFLKLTKVSEIKRTLFWKRKKNCQNVENLKLRVALLGKQPLKNNM